MLPTVILYTASLTSASFLWFGIFVITRRRITPKTPWWQDSLIFTGVAAILIAWYLVGIGLETAASADSVQAVIQSVTASQTFATQH